MGNITNYLKGTNVTTIVKFDIMLHKLDIHHICIYVTARNFFAK